MESMDRGDRSDIEVSNADPQMVGANQGDWVARARSEYEAAKESAADAIIHYHRAAVEVRAAMEAHKLTQEEIGSQLGISQGSVSKLLAWEKKYRLQLEARATDELPVPSPYMPLTPEHKQERNNRKEERRNRAATTQRQYQQIQRSYEDQIRALTTELEHKDARLAELEMGSDFVEPAAGTDDDPPDIAVDVEGTIMNLLSKLPTADERLEMLARVEARLLAEQRPAS
jgi:transcriptional regulator with XRE-family HTH domain